MDPLGEKNGEFHRKHVKMDPNLTHEFLLASFSEKVAKCVMKARIDRGWWHRMRLVNDEVN